MHTRASTRVLVVEDEPTDALMVRRSLLRPGAGDGRFEVRHATTLAEGLEHLRRDPADVLLLDLSLPDSDGLDTVVRFRVRAPNVPLVVLTGSDDPKLAARTLEAGADGHLVKGELGARVLRRVLLQAIERREASLQAPRSAAPLERDTPEDERRLAQDLLNLNALVLGNAQVLRDEVASHPRLLARVDALLRAARLAAALTERVLARSAAEEAPPDAVDLSKFVSGAESLVRALVPARIGLIFELADGLDAVTVRVEKLLGALLELVANAVASVGDDEGALELTTGACVIENVALPGFVARDGFEPGPHVWIEVRDDGRGFDAASLFQQLRPPSSPEAGPGYGSSHLEQLLADGAALFVDSRPGAGATFRILLRSRLPH